MERSHSGSSLGRILCRRASTTLDNDQQTDQNLYGYHELRNTKDHEHFVDFGGSQICDKHLRLWSKSQDSGITNSNHCKKLKKICEDFYIPFSGSKCLLRQH